VLFKIHLNATDSVILIGLLKLLDMLLNHIITCNPYLPKDVSRFLGLFQTVSRITVIQLS